MQDKDYINLKQLENSRSTNVIYVCSNIDSAKVHFNEMLRKEDIKNLEFISRQRLVIKLMHGDFYYFISQSNINSLIGRSYKKIEFIN